MKPDLYVVFLGKAFYACQEAPYVGALLAAPVNADGSIAWDESVDVESYEGGAAKIRQICALIGAKYEGPSAAEIAANPAQYAER